MQLLRNADRATQEKVLERGNLLDCKNPTAVLISRIQTAEDTGMIGINKHDLKGSPEEAWARICAKKNIGPPQQVTSSITVDPAMAAYAQHQMAQQQLAAQQSLLYLQQLAAQQQQLASMAALAPAAPPPPPPVVVAPLLPQQQQVLALPTMPAPTVPGLPGSLAPPQPIPGLAEAQPAAPTVPGLPGGLPSPQPMAGLPETQPLAGLPQQVPGIPTLDVGAQLLSVGAASSVAPAVGSVSPAGVLPGFPGGMPSNLTLNPAPALPTAVAGADAASLPLAGLAALSGTLPTSFPGLSGPLPAGGADFQAVATPVAGGVRAAPY